MSIESSLPGKDSSKVDKVKDTQSTSPGVGFKDYNPSEEDKRRWAAEELMSDEQKRASGERARSALPDGTRHHSYLLQTQLESLKNQKLTEIKDETFEQLKHRLDARNARMMDIDGRLKINKRMLREKLDALDPAVRSELAELNDQDYKLHTALENLIISRPPTKDKFDKEYSDLKLKIDQVGNRINEIEDKYNL